MSNVFKPVQPTAGKFGSDVVYEEFLPAEELSEHIYRYWQLKTDKPLEEDFVYNVIADGCIDIFFELNDRSEGSFVMGFCRNSVAFSIGKSFAYFGIRFFPGIFPAVFSTDAKLLRDKSSVLKDFAPETDLFIENQIRSKSYPTEIVKKLDEYFLEFIAGKSINIDNRFLKALSLIYQQKGSLNVEEDLNVGISSRQLRRLFEFYIGDTPKSFSRVIRFQNLFSEGAEPTEIVKEKLYFDAGYYDQSHFLKEFKALYGKTPKS